MYVNTILCRIYNRHSTEPVSIESGSISEGKSSHKLLSEYRHLQKKYWGQHLWSRGYWVCTSGNVTDEVWKEYIKNQKPLEPDDDFNIV
jgi:REP element-mobilizing transposase RayT